MFNYFTLVKLLVFVASIFVADSQISLPKPPNYHHIYNCVFNITQTYADKRNIVFIMQEIDDSDFMSGLLNIVVGPRKILDENHLGSTNLTHQETFFVFLAHKNKFYGKILEALIFLDNSRFLIVWLEADTTILHVKSVFQEFWNFELLDVIAITRMKYGGLGVYTYFPYTKTQCADSGTPIMIDMWSTYANKFKRNADLFSRKSKVYNLHGCPLKCAGAHRPPDSIIEETGNKSYDLSGIGGILFQTIAETMNFTPIITRVVDLTSNYGTIYSNESSTLSLDVANKKVDIGFGIFTRLLDYHPKVTLVKETNMDCFTWAVPLNAGSDPSMWTTYINEFSSITWLLVGLTLILAIFVIYFLARCAFKENRKFRRWDILCLFVYFTFLGATVKEKAHSNVLRVFLGPWLFYCLVLGAAYNAQLGSYATVPAKSGNIESTSDLMGTNLGITGAPQMYYILNASINTSHAIKMLLKRFQVLPPGNFLTVVEKVVDERNTALFSTKSLLLYCNERMKARHLPSTYVQPLCVIKAPSSPMIVRNVSPLREPLSDIIHHLFEAGMLTRWENDAKEQINSRGFHKHEPKLYLKQMQGAFVLLGTGMALSTLVFFGEIVTNKFIRPPPDLLSQLIADGYRIPFTK